MISEISKEITRETIPKKTILNTVEKPILGFSLDGMIRSYINAHPYEMYRAITSGDQFDVAKSIIRYNAITELVNDRKVLFEMNLPDPDKYKYMIRDQENLINESKRFTEYLLHKWSENKQE